MSIKTEVEIMSISINTIKQDLIEVEDKLEENDIEGVRDLFSKLKEDAYEMLESIEIFFCDVKKD
jgi:phosphate uptake regulator